MCITILLPPPLLPPPPPPLLPRPPLPWIQLPTWVAISSPKPANPLPATPAVLPRVSNTLFSSAPATVRSLPGLETEVCLAIASSMRLHKPLFLPVSVSLALALALHRPRPFSHFLSLSLPLSTWEGEGRSCFRLARRVMFTRCSFPPGVSETLFPSDALEMFFLPTHSTSHAQERSESPRKSFVYFIFLYNRPTLKTTPPSPP